MYAQILIQEDKHLSDSILVDQALSGDQSAFEALVCRYELALYNFVKRYLEDQEQAGDIVQFVFLQLYKFLPRLQGNLFSARSNAPLKSWLFRVAVNRCRQEQREKQLLYFSALEVIADDDTVTIEQSLADPMPLPEEVAEQHELQENLYAAIEALPIHSRSVVLLRYTEGLSFNEIGQRLNMPLNTVKSHFHRARLRLRITLALQVE